MSKLRLKILTSSFQTRQTLQDVMASLLFLVSLNKINIEVCKIKLTRANTHLSSRSRFKPRCWGTHCLRLANCSSFSTCKWTPITDTTQCLYCYVITTEFFGLRSEASLSRVILDNEPLMSELCFLNLGKLYLIKIFIFLSLIMHVFITVLIFF